MTLIDTSAWIESVLATALHHNAPLFSCDPHFALARDRGLVPVRLP